MDTVQTATKLEEDIENSLPKTASKKPTNRPAMQIYRPPGLRTDGSTSSSTTSSSSTMTTIQQITKPKTAAGQKLSSIESENINQAINKEENNNKQQKDSIESVSSRASSQASNQNGSLKRTESSLSSESTPSSQKSYGSNSTKLNGQYMTNGGNNQLYNKRINTNYKKEQLKKKVMSEHEIEKSITEIRALQLHSHSIQIEQWIGGAFCDEELAESIGSALCRHAIEGGGGSGVSKVCANFKNAPSIVSFVKGLTVALSQYLDCRQKIREDHFRMWISFIQFLTELYANLGSDSKGDLATIVFDVFNYLLRPPILENVKIQELECLISILIKGGYDLERECPDRLALLKDLIRDAFIDVPEPWARKMILLLLELGASGWKLPADANEYYFNETSN